MTHQEMSDLATRMGAQLIGHVPAGVAYVVIVVEANTEDGAAATVGSVRSDQIPRLLRDVAEQLDARAVLGSMPVAGSA